MEFYLVCYEVHSFGSVAVNNNLSTVLKRAGKSYWRGRLSTVDLLVLTSLDQLLFAVMIFFYLCYKTSYLNEEVNCTEPSPSVSVPCSEFSYLSMFLSSFFVFPTWVFFFFPSFIPIQLCFPCQGSTNKFLHRFLWSDYAIKADLGPQLVFVNIIDIDHRCHRYLWLISQIEAIDVIDSYDGYHSHRNVKRVDCSVSVCPIPTGNGTTFFEKC